MKSNDASRVPLFASPRERRLWTWTLIVVVGIYSTLGIAGTLVEALIDRGLFDLAFVIGFLLIGAAILTQGLKIRPRGAEIGVILGVAAVYLMVLSRLGIPERTHLFEYGVVAIFIYEALSERSIQGRRVPVPAVLALLAASLVGVFDECIQFFLPSRVFDPVDIGVNFLAALLAVTSSAAFGWTRRLAGHWTRLRSA